MPCKTMLIVFFGYFNAGNYYLQGEQQVNKEKNININLWYLKNDFPPPANLIKVENTQTKTNRMLL